VPVQPPEAVHVVALVEVQLSVERAPALTVVGLALSVSVGAGGGGVFTVTVTERCTEPPAPVHCRVNVLF
jgi:hypothetical protein